MFSRMLRTLYKRYLFTKKHRKKLEKRSSHYEPLEERHMLSCTPSPLVCWENSPELLDFSGDSDKDVKVLISTQEDLDQDGIPDWKDGFNGNEDTDTDPANNDDDDVIEGVSVAAGNRAYFEKLTFTIPGTWSSSNVTEFEVSYSGNTPTGGEWVFEEPPEGIRLWTQPAHVTRNPDPAYDPNENVLPGEARTYDPSYGHYVPPNTPLKVSPGQVLVFYVEAIDTGEFDINNSDTNLEKLGVKANAGVQQIHFEAYQGVKHPTLGDEYESDDAYVMPNSIVKGNSYE